MGNHGGSFSGKYAVLLALIVGSYSASTTGSRHIRILNRTRGYESHKKSPHLNICGYRVEAGNSTYDQEVECGLEKQSCFAAVAVTDRGLSFELTVINQGCWPDKPHTQCDEDVCIIRTPIPTHAGRILPEFCCCKGLYCNLNLSYVPRAVPSRNRTKATIIGNSGFKGSKASDTIVLGVVSSVFALALILAIILVSWRCLNQRKALKLHLQTTDSIENDNEVTQGLVLDLNNIAFGDLIHQGHYSTVRKGRYEGCDVVVKSYPPHSHNHWQNERSIYYMAGNHKSIAKFLASFEVNAECGPEGVLVMEYYPNGSLLSYLKQNTLSWDQMCQLALTVSNGLAYLHGEVDEYCTDQTKRPVIVHRDLNSRNVLVKLDGSCVLADFGFAVHLTGKLGEPYPEVGTVRYMPPEMLEGAVNWHDESALKQADVYSLGLVLWEIARRCREPYGDDPVPEARLPYEAELPGHPSPDFIHQLVVHDFVRPSFPSQWRGSHLVYQLLRDTIEECWDHEPEARLTALCVVRRIQEVIQGKQLKQTRDCDNFVVPWSLKELQKPKDSVLKNIVLKGSEKPGLYEALSNRSDGPLMLTSVDIPYSLSKNKLCQFDPGLTSGDSSVCATKALTGMTVLNSGKNFGSDVLKELTIDIDIADGVPTTETRLGNEDGLMFSSLPLDLYKYTTHPSIDIGVS